MKENKYVYKEAKTSFGQIDKRQHELVTHVEFNKYINEFLTQGNHQDDALVEMYGVASDHETRLETAEDTLVNHTQQLANHEMRVTKAEETLVNHENRITHNTNMNNAQDEVINNLNERLKVVEDNNADFKVVTVFANNVQKVETFVAQAGQRNFRLNLASYIPGQNRLAVYVDGIQQTVNDGFVEVDSRTFQFTEGLTEGMKVTAHYFTEETSDDLTDIMETIKEGPAILEGLVEKAEKIKADSILVQPTKPLPEDNCDIWFDTSEDDFFVIENMELTSVEGVALAQRLSELKDDIQDTEQKLDETNAQLSEINNKKITYLTPEMFGAVGDGVTDDVEPLMRLINYVKSNAPQIDVGGGEMLRDYGVFTFVFKGKYAISSQIIIYGGYNLSINDLYLTSTKNFNGESLVKVVSTFRNSWLKNCIFDGNKWTTSCFLLEGNSLNNQFTSCTFRRFKDYGFKAINKGHELIFDGCKFNQFEWGDRDKGVIPDFLVDGVGLGLYDDRHDNHISNCIINYCLGHALDIFSGSNMINNTHFYSGEGVEYGVYVKGSHNFFNSCFFDSSLVGLNGQNSIKNSFFMTSGDHTFIEFMDSESNKWKYGVSEVMGNRFQGNTSQISLPFKCKNFDFDNTFSNIYDNTFHNCLDVWRWYSKASESYNPSPFTKFSENLSDTGYQIIGNIKYVWGYATDSTITIDCSRILNVQATGWSSPPNSPYAPYVTGITNNSFKLNCQGTACYFVVCVV